MCSSDLLTFSEAVTSSGNVTVTLETGSTDRTCTFSVSNSTTASCTYTVQAGDTSSDLTVNGVSGTIADQSSNAMTNFTPATNLAANKAIVIDTTAPTGSITSPAASATLSGTTSLTASASDNDAVASVQFKVDGTNQGSADTTSPFGISWNTASVSNGSHTISAVITDTAGNTTTTSSVSITVSNTVPADTTAPSVPANLSGQAASVSAIDLSWSASTDDTAVAAYDIYRDGALVASTGLTTYEDGSLASGTTYRYSVLAKDAAGNESAQSGAVSVTTLSPSSDDGKKSSGGGSSKKKKKKSVSGKITTRAGERIAPYITLITPRIGTAISGSLTVSAVAADRSGMQAMIVTVNGTRKKRSNTASVSYTGKNLKGKSTTISVNAYDALGNRKTADISIVSGRVVGVRYW